MMRPPFAPPLGQKVGGGRPPAPPVPKPMLFENNPTDRAFVKCVNGKFTSTDFHCT